MRYRVGFVAVAVAALVISGCGSSDDDDADTAGNDAGVEISTTTAGPPATGNGDEPVTVEVDAGDFDFESSVTTFKVGVPYRFVVTNTGDEEHEFMIVEPIEAGAMDMEEMDDLALVDIEEDDLPAGATATVDVTFDEAYPAGTLEMACHIGQHYEKGMRLPIVVEP